MLLKVEKLREIANPFTDDVWGVGVLSKDDIARAKSIETSWQQDWTREQHAGRIKWFVENRQWKPIGVELGFPGLCLPSIYDGNHRLGAAIYLKLESIECKVYGCLEFLKHYS